MPGPGAAADPLAVVGRARSRTRGSCTPSAGGREGAGAAFFATFGGRAAAGAAGLPAGFAAAAFAWAFGAAFAGFFAAGAAFVVFFFSTMS